MQQFRSMCAFHRMGFESHRSAWRMQQDSPPSCQPRIRCRRRRRPGRSCRWCACVCACTTFFPPLPVRGSVFCRGGSSIASAALNNGTGRGRPPGGSGRGQCILPAHAKAIMRSVAALRPRQVVAAAAQLSFFSLQAALYFFLPPPSERESKESERAKRARESLALNTECSSCLD